jgi:hypothetical protein
MPTRQIIEGALSFKGRPIPERHAPPLTDWRHRLWPQKSQGQQPYGVKIWLRDPPDQKIKPS